MAWNALASFAHSLTVLWPRRAYAATLRHRLKGLEQRDQIAINHVAAEQRYARQLKDELIGWLAENARQRRRLRDKLARLEGNKT